jgi:hypothetical protein
MERVDGAHAALISARRSLHRRQMPELVRDVMQPLQRRLREAGFDGMVWQAGLGNPVAGGNFMRLGPRRWVWIDTESGIPALAPLNPWTLASFYLPASFRHGRPLFDDVDTDRLRAYLAAHEDDLCIEAGRLNFMEIRTCVDALEHHQRAWRSQSRFRRSLEYFHVTGRITDRQAEHYADRPVRWYTRLAAVLTARLARRAAGLVGQGARWLVSRNWRLLAVSAARFVSSQQFRHTVAERYVRRRIIAWRHRRFMPMREMRVLREELNRDEAGSYLTDFAVHLAIKPPLKVVQWWVLPALFVLGLINAWSLAAGIAFGGMACRTVYTLGRMAQATVLGHRRPWVALAVGLMPMGGNAAYPAQLLWSGSDHGRRLPQFILFDLFASIGRSIPVWGGRDSLVEHGFNRLPLALRWLRALRPARGSLPVVQRAAN